MYARTYGDLTYSFEASGGLIHGALVMQDFETNSYWSMMSSKAIAGPATGQVLRELPGAKKVQWKDWLKQHPASLVLSVRLGRSVPYRWRGKLIRIERLEDLPRNPYLAYFSSQAGFNGLKATDRRLETKAPVFAFQARKRKVAIPFSAFEGGASFKLGTDRWLFLYRPAQVEVFHSSVAFVSRAPFSKTKAGWMHPQGGAFQPEKGKWEHDLAELPGFDTYWYTWSLAHPKTELIR